MVIGLDKFTAWFDGYSDKYIIIGGTACDAVLTDAGLTPRATKDIDIILIIEALSKDFVVRFWDFVRAAGYRNCEQEMEKRNAYRFLNPSDVAYPRQIELFCRKPNALELPSDLHITPIPVEEGLSSLSAILLNDDYYNFTLQNSSSEGGVRYADAVALVCLKAYAYLSNKKLRESGVDVHSVNIEKHKNDVFRILPLLPSNQMIELPDSIHSDMQVFAESIKNALPSQQVLEDAGYLNFTPETVYQTLLSVFKLK